ncbi:GH25 family lysozyme, partial [Clostridium neonatale]|uniref:GH25 family lysozyme n=1 Tax=Clostridium neonatale TaxID=137838 RepID=UPI0029370140
MFKGIDVSNNNGSINFNKVKSDGVEVVYIKATEGTTFKDGYLDGNYSNAHSVGLKTGFYHFLVGTSSPETQAINFYNAIKNKSNDLIPMLDIETNFNGLIDYAERFIKKFKEISNMQIGIYTYTGFLSN